MVKLKRAYDTPAAEDGYRVLVDRLWPRGLTKERAQLDLWLKEVAPSNQLRQWFGHKPERYKQFCEKYREELEHNAQLAELRQLRAEHSVLTLVYAARDIEHNHALVLKDLLGAK